MKLILTLVCVAAVALAQQPNTVEATLCVNGNCSGYYAPTLPCHQNPVVAQVFSNYTFAYFEIYGCLGEPQLSTQICLFTTELAVEVGVWLIACGYTDNQGYAQVAFTCQPGFQVDHSIQAVVYSTTASACGYFVSQAAYIQTP